MDRGKNRNREGIALPAAPGVDTDIGEENRSRRAQFGTAPEPAPPTRNVENDAVRVQRVARIKKALVDGSYYVTSPEIADKLIKHMLKRGR
jgi:anti-sigma28 factor (negative regulator of flagellin synthesis)